MIFLTKQKKSMHLTCSVYSLFCCGLFCFIPLVLLIAIPFNHYIVKKHDQAPVAHDLHPELLWDDQEFQNIAQWTAIGVGVCYACILVCLLKISCFSRTPKTYVNLRKENSYQFV